MGGGGLDKKQVKKIYSINKPSGVFPLSIYGFTCFPRIPLSPLFVFRFFNNPWEEQNQRDVGCRKPDSFFSIKYYVPPSSLPKNILLYPDGNPLDETCRNFSSASFRSLLLSCFIQGLHIQHMVDDGFKSGTSGCLGACSKPIFPHKSTTYFLKHPNSHHLPSTYHGGICV